MKKEIGMFDYIKIKDFCLTKDTMYTINNQLSDQDICFV